MQICRSKYSVYMLYTYYDSLVGSFNWNSWSTFYMPTAKGLVLAAGRQSTSLASSLLFLTGIGTQHPANSLDLVKDIVECYS